MVVVWRGCLPCVCVFVGVSGTAFYSPLLSVDWGLDHRCLSLQVSGASALNIYSFSFNCLTVCQYFTHYCECNHSTSATCISFAKVCM